MPNFSDWLKRRNEWYGGVASNPSGTGEDSDEVDPEKSAEKPGAFPTIGDDKPFTASDRKKKLVGFSGGKVYAKKKCNCK